MTKNQTSEASFLDELESLEPWTETLADKLFTALTVLVMVTIPAAAILLSSIGIL